MPKYLPGFTREECASWVQAWGSIGAILITAGLYWAQGKRDELRRLRDSEDEMWGTAMLGLGALGAAQGAVQRLEFTLTEPKSGNYHHYASDLEEACASLRDVLATPVFPEARVHLGAVLAILQRLARDEKAGTALPHLKRMLTSAKSAIDGAVAYLRPLRRREAPHTTRDTSNTSRNS